MKSAAVLFISHTADRTGAPIELLRFLRWLDVHTSHRVLTLLQHGGELEADFRALGSTRVWKRPLKTKKGWLHKTLEILRWEGFRNHLRWFGIRCWLLRFRVQLVYANTAFCGESLALLQGLQAPRVCRLHELAYILGNFRYPHGFNSFQQTLRSCDEYIVVSEAVARNLEVSHGVSPGRLHKVHGSVTPVDEDGYLDPSRTSHLKKKLRISADAHVVGGCGSLHWHKGPDLFVQLAAILSRLGREDIHFLWLGGDLDSPPYRRLEFDIIRAGLSKRMHFVGHKADPYPYYALMDVLTLVSREDAFPLANIEAGLLGKPVVCFQGSGGTEEWVDRGCGRAVPYLNLDAFLREILELIDNAAVRAEMGDNCRREARNLLVERNAPRLHRILEALMAGDG